MEKLTSQQAVDLARDIANSIADGIDKVNATAKDAADPLMSKTRFIEEMTIEMSKLVVHKFHIVDN